MGALYDLLQEDYRFREGMKACINCGTCTAICPAASFYNYEPRSIMACVQQRDDKCIAELLRGEEIWYCAECMSCKTRCPRGNAPGLVITALRSLSQRTGMFTCSEKGRQQLAIKRMIGETILSHGYCVYAEHVDTVKFPEQGPVWDWIRAHLPEVMERLGANFQKEGAGNLRKIDDNTLKELSAIFKTTGALDLFDTIEKASAEKAKEMGVEFTGHGTTDGYFTKVFTENNQTHTRE
ncbi:MAG: 4Fe-4S dicluster domain-containing protein [Bacteroidales bacterium]|nr:4Fe-4S dicluster domain-containing protein [Bacteroidales bacterium]